MPIALKLGVGDKVQEGFGTEQYQVWTTDLPHVLPSKFFYPNSESTPLSNITLRHPLLF